MGTYSHCVTIQIYFHFLCHIDPNNALCRPKRQFSPITVFRWTSNELHLDRASLMSILRPICTIFLKTFVFTSCTVLQEIVNIVVNINNLRKRETLLSWKKENVFEQKSFFCNKLFQFEP